VIEGQKRMCVIDCCAQFLSLGGRNPPRCSPFLWFCLVLSIFALNFLLERHFATAHKPVCVWFTCKGEGGKCQNKKRL
jgi:hypothetical protein